MHCYGMSLAFSTALSSSEHVRDVRGENQMRLLDHLIKPLR